MSGVDAQCDPCTATIFWLLCVRVSFIAPVVPYLWKVQYLTQRNFILVSWVHKNFYLSDEIWNQLKPSSFFPSRFLVVHISPTRTGELNSHLQQSPMSVKGLYTTGCCPVPWRGRLWHCYLHLSAMEPLARCLTPWLRWTRSLFAVLGHYPPRDEDA
jgi:hypothetical protein